MKQYDTYLSRKRHDQQHKKEEQAGTFRCGHCRALVVVNDYIGTHNRNHCNFCLWSKHVDVKKGDRQALCQAGMEPIGLTLKHEGYSRTGELMLVHRCSGCLKISINRLAGDDDISSIQTVFENSLGSYELKTSLENESVMLLSETEREELETQLYGR